MTDILAAISQFIIAVISTGGYAGVFALMFLQSANIPIPSEVTMPFAGFLAERGVFNFWGLVFIGALGNVAGALISHNLASFLLKNGLRERYHLLGILLSDHGLRIAEKWFQKFGSASVFFGRLVPVVSTFVSFPAGLARMPIGKFAALTFAGSFLWSLFLAWLGFSLAQNWAVVGVYFRKFDYVIITAIVIVIALWLWRYLRNYYRDRAVPGN